MQAALHLEAVARDCRAGQDEFARRLEVVIQAVERRQMHVAPGGGDRNRGRRGRRRGKHRAGDRQRHRGQRGAVSGGVGVRRRHRHGLGEGADGVGLHFHHRRGVRGPGANRRERRQPAVDELIGAGEREGAGQQVGRDDAVVQHAIAGLERRAVLINRAEVQHIGRAAAGQVAVAGHALDQRLRRIARGRPGVEDLRLRQRREHRLPAFRCDFHLQVFVWRAAQHIGRQGDGEHRAGLAGGDRDGAARQRAAEVGRGQEPGSRCGDLVVDRRRVCLGAGEVDGKANRPWSRGRFDHAHGIGLDADIRGNRRRRRGRRGRGGGGRAFLLLHVGAAGQRLRIAGEQIVDHRCFQQVRIGYARRRGRRFRLRNRVGRQVAEADLVVGEVGVGEGRGVLAGAVIHQRGGVGHPPGVGILAVQFGVGRRLRQHRAAGQRQVVGRVAAVCTQQTLHIARIAVRQGNCGVEVGPFVGDVEFLAGVPQQPVAVGGGLLQRAVRQRHHGRGQGNRRSVDPNHFGAADGEGDAIRADLGGDLGVDADRGAVRPGLHARLDVEAVAGDGRLRQDELARRLEVVIQAVERGQVHIAPGIAGAGRRRRQRGRHHGAGDRHRLRRQHPRIAARVVARRRQGHRFGERAHRAGGQHDDRCAVDLLRGQILERTEAGIDELRRAGNRELAGEQVGRAQHVVVDAKIGAQRRGVLRHRAEVQHIMRSHARRGQRAVAAELLDRRNRVLVNVDRRLDVGHAEAGGAVRVDAGAVALQRDLDVAGIGAEVGGRERRRQRRVVALPGRNDGRTGGSGHIGAEIDDRGVEVFGVAVGGRGVADGDRLRRGAAAIALMHVDRVGREIGGGRAVDRAGDFDRGAAVRRRVAVARVGDVVQRDIAGLNARRRRIDPRVHPGVAGRARREIGDRTGGVGLAGRRVGRDVQAGRTGPGGVADAERGRGGVALVERAEIDRTAGVQQSGRRGDHRFGHRDRLRRQDRREAGDVLIDRVDDDGLGLRAEMAAVGLQHEALVAGLGG